MLNIGKENFLLWLRSFNNNRALPNFMIVGVQKAGTTTLYDYIIQHPKVIPAFRKETKYFDLYRQKSLNWYKAFFPVLSNNCITGEATPDYFYYNEIPKQIQTILPKVKLIVLLRNPAERAISHYNFNIDRKIENLPFDDAIKKEQERISNNFTIKLKSGYKSNSFREFSYVSRGLYAKQLQNWLNFFPIKQFFFCSTAQLHLNPLQTLNEIYNFLNLSPLKEVNSFTKNASKNKVIIPGEYLKNFKESFITENENLYKLIGKNFNW